MFSDWLVPPPSLFWVMMPTLGLYRVVVVIARLSGARSFAEMSTFESNAGIQPAV